MAFITRKMLFTLFDVPRPYGLRCNTPSIWLTEQAQKILYVSFQMPLNLFHYLTCFHQRVALCATMQAPLIITVF